MTDEHRQGEKGGGRIVGSGYGRRSTHSRLTGRHPILCDRIDKSQLTVDHQDYQRACSDFAPAVWFWQAIWDCMCTIERWEPTFLYPGRPPHELIALIILNTPITDTATFRQIWFKASYRVCADGGANRLLAASEAMRQSFVPDLIKGDLDSIRPDIKRHFEQLGVPIVEDPDQYATDLGKCVKAVAEQDAAKRTEHVIVILGGLQGRLDQTMHTLHAITKLAKTRKRVWVVSEESLACVLDKGEHELVIDQHILGPTCGLLPIGTDSALVTTKGLEWNLSDTETSMSTMVSTSNHIVSDLVQVTTNRLIVWTCAILAS